MRKKYEFCAVCLILALTFLLAYGSSLTETNFSVIGNGAERKLLFLIWGASVGNFCYLYMDELLNRTACTDPLVRGFLVASLLLLIVGIGLPYLPKKVPVLSRLHVMITFLSPVCFGISQFRFLWLLQKKTGNVWRWQWCMQLVIGGVSVFLLFHNGMVTSFLEIFLTLGLCLYLWLLQRKLEKFQDNL